MLPLTSYKLILCTLIFAVLLLKYCFPTGDQFFTIATPLVTVTYYLY